MEQFLVSEKCLQRWSGWTLKERVDDLTRKGGVTIAPCTLWQFYKKNNIKVRYANYMYKHVETD